MFEKLPSSVNIVPPPDWLKARCLCGYFGLLGAGPAGVSAAYNVRKFARQKGILVDITVYEKNDFIGGRSTCRVDVQDDQGNDYYTVQIAAKGFHASDKTLVDTVNQLKLTPVMLDGRQDTDLSGRSGERWGVYVFSLLS